MNRRERRNKRIAHEKRVRLVERNKKQMEISVEKQPEPFGRYPRIAGIYGSVFSRY